MYDFLLVGSCLFSAVFAHQTALANKNCLVLERRNHIGGNCYSYTEEGIEVHKYGAHIFRTSDEQVWEFVNLFDSFNHFINSPIANYKGELYNLPFNMNTFHQIFGVNTPDEAKKIIEEQRKEITWEPRNLEEKAICLVGRDIYKKLIKGYTEKQWGRPCNELPSSILRRLPVRYIFDNNYFSAEYQGIPKNGYTKMISKMLSKAEIKLNCDYNTDRENYNKMARQIVYTGAIDELFNYQFGHPEYRSLRFEHKVFECENYQGVAVMNYTDREVPYTRTIEHKHFTFGQQPKTVVSYEYPLEWDVRQEPYYPINNEKNQKMYACYLELARALPNLHLGGRLAEYKYYDMQDTIKSALNLSEKLIV